MNHERYRNRTGSMRDSVVNCNVVKRSKGHAMKKICLILQLLLICCTCVTAFADGAGTGSISGRVMIREGVPMRDGLIFIFNADSGAPPSFDRYWRVPDEIAPIDGDGSFKAVLSKGRYYLGAIKRKSNEDIGPLQDGDLFLPFYADGAPIGYAVSSGSTTDLGMVYGAKLFSTSILKTGAGVTAITGVVRDSGGKPLENALVFAFPTPSMLGKPLFISEKTGKDGTYMLRVYEGGSYYLKIRNSYGGGAMKAGEIMGTYGQENPMAVPVKTGVTVKGIDMTGTTFAGQGPKRNMKK